MSDHTPTPDATISDATGDTAIDIPVDAAPPATTIVATPEWVCTAPSPLAATLALDEYATRTGRPATLWPTSRTGTAATMTDAVPMDDPQGAIGRETATESTDPAWTIESIRGLGMTTDVETAASILGFGRTKAYELAKSGDFPVRLLRIGRRYVVPVPAILRLLGAE